MPQPNRPQDRFRLPRSTGTVAVLLAVWLVLAAGCGKEPATGGGPAGDGPETFTFFDLGRTTALTVEIRQRLSRELGTAAVEHRGILDLAPDGRRLLADHFPDLDRLNRRLNKDYRERVEHDLLKLMYRYPTRTSPSFESVRLVFDASANRPLHFQITANQAGSEIIAVLKDKYGPPREAADSSGPLLVWENKGDRLLVLPRRSRLGQPEYQIRIYFVANIEALLAREAQEDVKGGARDARSAF